jgi:hypothetical protein
MTDDDGWLDTEGVAFVLGISTSTVTIYLSRTRTKIAKGIPLTARDFPMPDQITRRSPMWKSDTIARHRTERLTVKRQPPQARVWMTIDAKDIVKGDRILIEDGPILYVRDKPVIGSGGIRLRTSRKRRSPGFIQTIALTAVVRALRPKTP